MEALKILSIIAISLFALLGIFLITNSKARIKGFGWLGLFFLLLAVNFVDGMLLLNGFYLELPKWAFWEDPNVLLYGPLIYFFSLRLKNIPISFRLKTLRHLLPYVIFMILVIIYHAISSAVQTKVLLLEIVEYRMGPRALWGVLPMFIHVLLYMTVAYKSLILHKNQLKQYYSFIEISWAFELVRMVLFIFSVSLAITFVQYFGKKEVFSILLLLLNIITVLLLFRILLLALRQPMFQTIRNEPVYGLSQEETQSLREKIENLLSKEKLYKKPELTVKDLADQLGVSQRMVSHIINQSMADNFYDLINAYRIKEAQRILNENVDPKFTVLELLYQVGYNSKSSFNTQFKKKTGMTPSEFKKLRKKLP
ncbi:MAG: AraC family transcriptional regulator [Bacteroidota bacterium]